MAVLNETIRALLHSELMQRISTMRDETALSKAQWRTLVDAADDWAEANAAAYNSAIPVGVRNTATADEKRLALAFVILKRYEVE